MIAQSVAGLLADHVRLTVEGIDRMYRERYQQRTGRSLARSVAVQPHLCEKFVRHRSLM